MMQRRIRLLLYIGLVLLLLAVSGCGPTANQPAPGSDAAQPPAGTAQPPAGGGSSAAHTGKPTMTLTVYFGTKDAQYLVPEQRTVPQNNHPAQTALELLLAGPTRSDLTALFPAGVKLHSVAVRDHVAYADFNDALVKNNHTGSAGEILQVAAIVNTLTNFSDIERVQILVDGQRVPTLAGHLDVSEPLSRSEQVIKNK